MNMMPPRSFFIVILVLMQLHPSASLASQPPLGSFQFDPLTGICRQPAAFRYTDEQTKESQYFVMRNTPGDGDCIFHAVLSGMLISMGMMSPDSEFSQSMALMSLQMRSVVAKFLSSPEGTLYVNNKPRKRIVLCRDLLQSAANNEGMSPEDYLVKLRQPGKQGGLYGGGPELTVLSNILRRPISIYHLKQATPQAASENLCEVERMGVFGEGLFEDPGQAVPSSVISNAVFFTLDGKATQQTEQSSKDVSRTSPLSSPFKCTWHLHILVADANESEKHATVLLPSVPILHKSQ